MQNVLLVNECKLRKKYKRLHEKIKLKEIERVQTKVEITTMLEMFEV